MMVVAPLEVEPEPTDSLEKMTISELKEFAVQNGYTVSMGRKTDIIKEIKEQMD